MLSCQRLNMVQDDCVIGRYLQIGGLIQRCLLLAANRLLLDAIAPSQVNALADRQTALSMKNPSAAITASSKVASLLLEELAASAAQTTPVVMVISKLVHLVVCPHCREAQPVSEHPPESTAIRISCDCAELIDSD